MQVMFPLRIKSMYVHHTTVRLLALIHGCAIPSSHRSFTHSVTLFGMLAGPLLETFLPSLAATTRSHCGRSRPMAAGRLSAMSTTRNSSKQHNRPIETLSTCADVIVLINVTLFSGHTRLCHHYTCYVCMYEVIEYLFTNRSIWH